MIKRYQVFVSSTYADLKEERAKVIQTIMELDCIPAGMEIFPAIDEEQFNFIKRIIDDCDYYLLIIGGRYGTVSEDGLSYTEKEYDYALEKRIKVLAFIHSNPEEIPIGKSEKDSKLREKLEIFKTKVSTNRLVKFWRTADELPGLVALSLSKTIKTYPAIGWIRANTIINPEVLQELNDQRKINEDLREKLEKASTIEEDNDYLKNLAGLEDEFTVQGAHSYSKNPKWETKIKWGELFSLISPYLIEHPVDDVVRKKLSNDIHQTIKDISGTHPYIDSQNFQTIKLHLQAIGLINLDFTKTSQGGMALFWSLTPKGTQLMMENRSIKKKE
ncbi:MAG TPA: DUF4062 domain-containing protein [Chitinophagales bacterium]|nr:DUF4062 domain-containing protein [Chitinophagales bacterium]